MIMRAFVLACLVILVVGGAGYLLLGSMQQSSGVAFATDGARIDPGWAWRSVSAPAGASETAQIECDMRKSWQWIFVDFGRPQGESAACSISQ
jgi:hypothetical protein